MSFLAKFGDHRHPFCCHAASWTCSAKGSPIALSWASFAWVRSRHQMNMEVGSRGAAVVYRQGGEDTYDSAEDIGIRSTLSPIRNHLSSLNVLWDSWDSL